MTEAQATNQINRDTEYEIPEDTYTEIVINGSPLTTTYNATIYLFPRDRKGKRNAIFPPNFTNANAWRVDGKIYSKFKISGDSAFNSLFDAGTLTAYYHVGYELVWNQGAMGFTRYTQEGQYSESWARLLEKLQPRYDAAQPVSFNSQIASGGANLTGTFDVVPGDELIVVMGISQDTLGTTPHLSTLYINDQNSLTVAICFGATVPSLVTHIRVPYQRNQGKTITWSYVAHNGDTVAHYFALSVYRLVA